MSNKYIHVFYSLWKALIGDRSSPPESQVAVDLTMQDPTIIDEHFVPLYGLDLESYIESGDFAGIHHLIRYLWSLKIVADLYSTGNILDVACGAGYGS